MHCSTCGDHGKISKEGVLPVEYCGECPTGTHLRNKEVLRSAQAEEVTEKLSPAEIQGLMSETSG